MALISPHAPMLRSPCLVLLSGVPANGCYLLSCAQLEAYHRFNEEAALRDHRRLGLELDLFRCGWTPPMDAADSSVWEPHRM